jgi:hypothetical protein
MRRIILALLMVVSSAAIAHDMTPTYPKLRPAFVEGVYVASMELFNKRDDVEYYEIGVFDKEWNPIPFVTSYEILHVRYLGHVNFEVFISKDDVSKATYICSKSKLRKAEDTRTALSSKVCSKFK